MTRYQLEQLYIKVASELQYYLFRKTKDIEIAADLLHDCFLKIMELGEQKIILNHRSYLYKIANNLLIDHFRNNSTKKMCTVSTEQLIDMIDAVEVVADHSHQFEIDRLLQKAIAQLPSRTRQIFLLQKIAGLTYLEVAKYLAISDSSVQKHLLKASEFIASYLTK